jgi:DNA-directed RNA polymerase specialized sigma subunit
LLEVTSEQVAAYEPLVQLHARRFGAIDYLNGHQDDLAQEGRIAVWQALQNDYLPGHVVVENAMKDYAKIERRKGLSGYEDIESLEAVASR